MAKITFITLYDKGCLGVRYICAYLKKEGHDTSIIYMGKHQGRIKDRRDVFTSDDNLWIAVTEYGRDLIRSYSDPISEEDIKILLNLLEKQKPDAVGFSLRTMFLDTAIRLTDHIRRKINTIIIYGGIAATSDPEKCIRHADMVCLGEGEDSMLQVADSLDDNKPLTSMKNMWVQHNGTIYKNTVAPLDQDIDSFPFPDYEPKNKFSILNSTLVKDDPTTI